MGVGIPVGVIAQVAGFSIADFGARLGAALSRREPDSIGAATRGDENYGGGKNPRINST
jgi:hypothetical protein